MDLFNVNHVRMKNEKKKNKKRKTDKLLITSYHNSCSSTSNSWWNMEAKEQCSPYHNNTHLS